MGRTRMTSRPAMWAARRARLSVFLLLPEHGAHPDDLQAGNVGGQARQAL